MAKKVTKKTEKEIAKISKFQNNPFAKKYKKWLETDEEFLARFKQDLDKFNKSYTYGADLADEDTVDSTVYAWQNAEQVKSWSRHERAIICDNLADIVLAAVVGLIVGVLLTINL